MHINFFISKNGNSSIHQPSFWLKHTGGNLSTINVSDFVFHVKFWDLWLELGKQIAMYIIIGQRNIWDSGQINSKSKQPKHLKSVNFRRFVIKSNYHKVTSSNTSR